MKYFKQPISEEIFKMKYCLHGEDSPEEVFEAISEEIASAEDESKRAYWKDTFYNELISGRLIPAGRILANARPDSPMKNYNNCFTIGVEDSLPSIFESLKEDAMISGVGGGVGLNISSLRPKGSPLSKGGESSGVISFLKVFDASAKVIMTGGSRRCLPKTKLVNAKNGMIPIGEIKVGDEVLTANGYCKVTNTFDQGVQETIIINTENGDFECTPNHKMPVFTSCFDYVWKEARLLEKGDRVVWVAEAIEGVPTELPKWEYTKPKHSTTSKAIVVPKLTPDVAWLIGNIFGDGCISLNDGKTKGSVSVAVGWDTPAIADKVEEVLRLFGVEPKRKQGDGEVWNIQAYSNQLAIYFSQFKLPNIDMRIPNFIMNGTKEVRGAFLAGLFDADGSSKDRPLNMVSSVYPKLIDDVVLLCSSLGINTRVKWRKRVSPNWKDIAKVTLPNSNAVRLFDIFVAPFSEKYVNTRTNSFYGKGRFDNKFPKSFVLSQNVNPKRLWSTSNKFMSFSTLRRITGCDLKLVPVCVEGISKGRMVDTCDIEVQSRHEFVSGGFLTHNSAHIAILNCDHPEIKEFVTCKQGEENNTLTQFNISVGITDAFIEAVDNNDDWDLVFDGKVYETIKARDLYDLIAENAFIHNEPGIFNLDTVQKYNNGAYAFKMDRVNPCFTGDTVVAVADGRNGVTIKELAEKGDAFLVYSAREKKNKGKWKEEIKEAVAFKTGEREVLNITLSDGSSFRCTPEHRLALPDGTYMEAKNSIGLELEKFYAFSNKNSNELYRDTNVDIPAVFVENIEWTGVVEDVYDLTVEDNHNFYIITKTDDNYLNSSGVLVHNCGEIPMPPYSLCCLSAINLTKFVRKPFTDEAFFDFLEFGKTIGVGVRFLDNVLDVTDYPLEKIETQSKKWRRIGLGFTGLGNVFMMLGLKYGSSDSLTLSEEIGNILRDSSYYASTIIAEEKGAFPECDTLKLMESEFIKQIKNTEVLDRIKKFGLRNIGLNTAAPTGTTSLSLGNNCSSGIEPTFALEYNRNIRTGRGDETRQEKVYDYAYLMYKELFGEDVEIPEHFSTTLDISIEAGIEVQSVFQKYIDHSISKTHNLAPGTTFEEYKDLFMLAYKKGLKGFTTFNPEGSMKGVLEHKSEKEEDRIAPKRPYALSCDIHHIKSKGDKFMILVGMLDERPYEIFVCDPVEGFKDTSGGIVKQKKGHYKLLNNGGEVVIEDLGNGAEKEYGIATRLLSLSLRHQDSSTPLQFTVDALLKDKDFTSFSRGVGRVLKKYIKEGEKNLKSKKCLECGSDNLIFVEGCETCADCGASKCG